MLDTKDSHLDSEPVPTRAAPPGSTATGATIGVDGGGGGLSLADPSGLCAPAAVPGGPSWPSLSWPLSPS